MGLEVFCRKAKYCKFQPAVTQPDAWNSNIISKTHFTRQPANVFPHRTVTNHSFSVQAGCRIACIIHIICWRIWTALAMCFQTCCYKHRVDLVPKLCSQWQILSHDPFEVKPADGSRPVIGWWEFWPFSVPHCRWLVSEFIIFIAPAQWAYFRCSFSLAGNCCCSLQR